MSASLNKAVNDSLLAPEAKTLLDAIIRFDEIAYTVSIDRSVVFNAEDSLWYDDLYQSNFLMSFTPQSLLAYAFRHPVDTTPPGTKYQYCNTNIILHTENYRMLQTGILRGLMRQV
ncbi:MAG: hypothetical protein NTY96_05085 [Bacteroidetes bacterium]|nr:hypothetical protein [Bacteroidota bacterium]